MNYTYNLGEILYSHIQKSGYSIYELSSKANVSRSMLQKVLSNERKLTKNYLEKLRPYLKVSPREYAELIKMTEEIQNGTFNYKTYQLLKDLLIKVNDTTAIYRDTKNVSSITVSKELERKEIYTGKAVVENLLRDCIRREYSMPTPHMLAYVPGESGLINQVLSQEGLISTACRAVTVKQIICFARDKSISDTAWQNVNALANVLPNIIVAKFSYEVFYYYGKELSDVHGEFGFPYYIIFSDSVMLLTADCTAAVLHTEKAVWEYFTNLFSEFMTNTVPLVTSCVKAEDILPHLFSEDTPGHHLYSLQYQPCLMANMTEDMVYDCALKTIPNYDVALGGVIFRIKQLQKLKSHTCYFSKAGLKGFAQTGLMADFPPEYATPLKVTNRIAILSGLYKEIETERHNHRMINPYAFPIPDTFLWILHQDIGIDLYGFGIDERNYNYINITEPSLLDIFSGFFQYLKDSMLICTKEETLECIKECIAELEELDKSS